MTPIASRPPLGRSISAVRINLARHLRGIFSLDRVSSAQHIYDANVNEVLRIASRINTPPPWQLGKIAFEW